MIYDICKTVYYIWYMKNSILYMFYICAFLSVVSLSVPSSLWCPWLQQGCDTTLTGGHTIERRALVCINWCSQIYTKAMIGYIDITEVLAYDDHRILVGRCRPNSHLHLGPMLGWIWSFRRGTYGGGIIHSWRWGTCRWGLRGHVDTPSHKETKTIFVYRLK